MSKQASAVAIIIDGKSVTCQAGETVIQAADREGIYIPRFCYHDRLSVVANCRMCLVDVHKAPKPMPACATPVADGMEVSTRSKRALDAQRSVMEFLLINHPLDCPICDQGGECELQDAAMGFGRGVSRYDQDKRAVVDEDLGPLIATEMTRCIHCTRCVRFGDEIAGMPELGALGRGENTQIGTYLQKGVHSELSGNMIDVCPVGALTAKPSRFKGRSWSFRQHKVIAQHDGVGSHAYAHTIVANTNEVPTVMRVVPAACDAINEVWLSNADRFAYTGLTHKDRLQTPWVKRQGQWHAVSWAEALDEAVSRFQGALARHGRDQAGALISPNASLETLYLLQKWMRSLGVANIDHRLRKAEASDVVSFVGGPTLGMPLERIAEQKVILLFGDDVRRTQPLLNHRIRQAQLSGAHVFAVGGRNPDYNYPVTGLWLRPDAWPVLLQALATGKAHKALNSDANAFVKAVRGAFSGTDAAYLLLGQDVMHHPEANALQQTAMTWAASETSLCLGHLSQGANTVGAHLMGVLPNQGPFGAPLEKEGLSTAACMENPLKAYWLHDIEPNFDMALGGKALAEADCVIASAVFDNPSLRVHADVLLPIAPYTEASGSVVNMEGRWQRSQAALPPLGECRPSWKIYRVLGNLSHSEGFDYADLQDVQREIDQLREASRLPKQAAVKLPKIGAFTGKGLCLLTQCPLERSDPILRRARPLQDALTAMRGLLWVNRVTLVSHGLTEGATYALQCGTKLPLGVDDSVADDVIYTQAAAADKALFAGIACGVELEACT